MSKQEPKKDEEIPFGWKEFLTTYGWGIIVVITAIAVLYHQGVLDKPEPDYHYLCKSTPENFCNITGYGTSDFFDCYGYMRCYCDEKDCDVFCFQQRYFLQNIDGGEIYEYLFINNTRIEVTQDMRDRCGWEKYEPSKLK